MQPWKKRQNHDCIFIIVERQATSYFSHNYIAHHICQHIRSESSYSVKLSYHTYKKIQLLFYAAVTLKETVRTFSS